MKSRRFAPVAVSVAVALFTSLAWSQASVNESLETKTLYVDATTGSDSNPGTKQWPLKTVSVAATQAVANNHAGLGTKVIINPGVYRESVSLDPSSKDTSLPITFQAAAAGTAIISGSDVWIGWKSVGGNLYTHSWSNKWGLCALDGAGAPPEEDIVRRREMIFINGTALAQVMNQSAMRVSTFFVDESHSTVYVWPPTGTNMGTAIVEVAMRDPVFTIHGKANIVLRGLAFQHASACRGTAALMVVFGASNILLDNISSNWNNSVGIKLSWVNNTTVQNSKANHNGNTGMAGHQTKYDLWQDDQTRYNGWRGAQGVYYGWVVAGTHFMKAHNQTAKNLDSSFNQTFGLHWALDNENDTADSLLASQNQIGSGFIENSEGPITISNSYFCNGNPYSGPNNVGFELKNSSNVTLTNDTLFNNLTQLYVIGKAGGVTITNWETGQNYRLFTQNTTLSNNIFYGGSDQLLLSNGKLGGTDWLKFQTTLSSDYNTWWNSADTKSFVVPVPADWTKVDFAGWKAASIQDKHSSWAQPGDPSAACKVRPDAADFWFIMSAYDGYQTVSPGSAALFTATVVPLAFSGTVSLSFDGVNKIPGASASWNPASIVSSGTADFTVKTSGSTPKGDYPVTLLATSGNITRTMTVTVTVQ
jgi:hypothetical protein